MEYSIRPSLLHKGPLTYELTENSLLIKEEDKPTITLDYKDIDRINPMYAPTKHNRNLYLTTIIDIRGKKTRITNQEYKGIADFGDRSEDYTKFITALHVKSRTANTSIKFVRGNSSTVYYLFSFIYAVALGVFLILAIVGLAMFNFIMIIVGLLGFFSLFTTAKRHFKFNKPLLYSINAVPPGLLPDIKTN